MPFFGNKLFSPKRAPPRKILTDNKELEELVGNQRTIHIKLGDQELVFENGEWIPESGPSGNTHRSYQKLKKRVHELQEENNLLRLKYSILLNMLVETKAASLQDKGDMKLKSLKHLKDSYI